MCDGTSAHLSCCFSNRPGDQPHLATVTAAVLVEAVTWEMRSWLAVSSVSISFLFWLLSPMVLSSCLLRLTIVFTSDFILLMYRRAIVNSSSIRPLLSCCCYIRRSKLFRQTFVALVKTFLAEIVNRFCLGKNAGSSLTANALKSSFKLKQQIKSLKITKKV